MSYPYNSEIVDNTRAVERNTSGVEHGNMLLERIVQLLEYQIETGGHTVPSPLERQFGDAVWPKGRGPK